MFSFHIHKSCLPSCVASAVGELLPLLQLCFCKLQIAAQKHSLCPMPLLQHHDAVSGNQSPGKSLLILGVMVVGAVAWCCCLLQ